MISAGKTMYERVRSAFVDQFGAGDDILVAMAPGRVNLIGEYTDFNNGFVLPMTLEQGVYVGIRRRTDERVKLYSRRFDELADYPLHDLGEPPPGSWQSYVIGVAAVLFERGLINGGFEAVIDGDLHHGAGLSSSAALEVAVAEALRAVFQFELAQIDLVKLCHQVEHTYAKVECGVMDQFACGMGKQGHALFLDCRSLAFESIPLQLDQHCFVVVNSGVERSLAASAYNVRRSECQTAVDVLRREHTAVDSLRDVSADMLAAQVSNLSPTVYARAAHVVSENQRVLAAVERLRSGDLSGFGELMYHSHDSLRDDFEVSCPELDSLVSIASQHDAVLGSRMTGAGFGGCTVTLVNKAAASDFMAWILQAYQQSSGIAADAFVVQDNRCAGVLHEH